MDEEIRKESHKDVIEKYLGDCLKDFPRKEEFWKYVDEIMSKPIRWEGEHLGYFGDNVKLANLIETNYKVIDVGCGFGFQHILYRNHQLYIGIQEFFPANVGNEKIEIPSFTENAHFFQGAFRDVYEEVMEKYRIGFDHNDVFVISNVSLISPGNEQMNKRDIEVFKQFKRLFIQ